MVGGAFLCFRVGAYIKVIPGGPMKLLFSFVTGCYAPDVVISLRGSFVVFFPSRYLVAKS